MKNKNYKKIVVDGQIYEYIVKENGGLCFKGIVTYSELQKIKEKLAKKK